MMAVGGVTLDQFFAQLYADADPVREPASAGRQMNAHFATRLRGADGSPLDLTDRVQSAADMSPTAGQMPRLVGLGYASRLYRELPGLEAFANFSHGGNEIAFGTIGNASTAEGHFWEAVNAIGVLRAAVLLSIWDDGYGISVANEYQICKADLSEMLSGFAPEARGKRRLRALQGSRLGLSRPRRNLSHGRRAGPPRPCAGDRACHRSHPAAGTLDFGQPRALQVGGSTGVRGRVRRTAPDARAG